MQVKTQSCVVAGKKTVAVTEQTIDWNNNGTLVQITRGGICGSDIPRVYELGTRVYPVVTGHEFAGEVVAVGNEKDKDVIGKKVAVFPLIPCRNCDP